jgi:serine/threonine-protein kinase
MNPSPPFARLPHLPRPDDVVVGKYRIGNVIGEGAMGVVVDAVDLVLERPVVLKLLRPELACDDESIARFQREARATARLTSENVVRVLELGAAAGTYFVAMERLRGEHLASRLRRAPVSCDDAVGWMLEACDALAEAHALGIVHRDLKPENMFLTLAGQRTILKVLDFGVAKMDGDGDRSPLTRQSTILGSPLYMAPEQFRASRDVDARADVWALGVILFELSTGRTPFDGGSAQALWWRVTTEPAPSARAIRPDVPPELDDTIARCLEKDPAARFADAGHLAARLTDVADGRRERLYRPSHVEMKVAR